LPASKQSGARGGGQGRGALGSPRGTGEPEDQPSGAIKAPLIAAAAPGMGSKDLIWPRAA